MIGRLCWLAGASAGAGGSTRTTRLHPKRLDPSIGAIAGRASAVSVIVGFIAQNAMGHGWHKASIALHLAKKPLIVRLAPAIAALAVGMATAAALLRFYNWYREARVRAAARSVEQEITEMPAHSTRVVEEDAAKAERE
jgi:hypothetical protein